MIKIENHLGVIDISHDFLTNLVGGTVVNCFGVSGMAVSTPKQGLQRKLSHQYNLKQGIKIKYAKSKLTIDLHIIVTYGTNISAIVKSIMNKVRYTVEETTGIAVAHVNVYVDGMKSE